MGTRLGGHLKVSLFILSVFLFMVFIFPAPGTSLAGQGPFSPCSFSSYKTLPLPRTRRSGPFAGEFLVATRQLTGSTFSRTVILLLEYSSGGAMGLMINRPSLVPLSKLFPEVKGLEQRRDFTYIGGPVELYKVFLLLDSKEDVSLPGRALRIFDNVYISPDMRTLREMALQRRAKFRVYAGYAGWASGQLDAEINRGDWYILNADEKTIFDTPAQEIWPALMMRAGIEAMNKNGFFFGSLQ